MTDAVWLENVDVDVSAFLDDAEAGLDAHDALRLEKAEALYVGEFLDEDLYQDWTAPLREEARAAYIRVTRTLSEMADAEGRTTPPPVTSGGSSNTTHTTNAPI